MYLSSPTAFTHAVGHGDLKRCQMLMSAEESSVRMMIGNDE